MKKSTDSLAPALYKSLYILNLYIFKIDTPYSFQNIFNPKVTFQHENLPTCASKLRDLTFTKLLLTSLTSLTSQTLKYRILSCEIIICLKKMTLRGGQLGYFKVGSVYAIFMKFDEK